MRSAVVVSILAALVATQTTAPRPASPPVWPLQVQPLKSPAAAGSGQPQLTTSARGVLMSWIENTAGRATLKFSERTPDGWSTPRAVASGSDWFVNWADVPSIVRLADGALAAHWLQRSGPDTYAYDVRLSYSRDDGRTWAPSVTPHHDGTKAEHGFASLFQMPEPGAGLGLVWLDGRQMHGGHPAEGDHSAGDMSLRFTTFGRNWKQSAESPLDVRVCECCPTAAAVTSDGPVVVYRDRSAKEVRDIYVTRLEKGNWSEPVPIFADGWTFNACPVNGPSVSARGRNVAVAWFQAKDAKPKAFLAFSRDAARTFGTPIRVDDGETLGRVDVELLADGAALVAYVDLTGAAPELRVKRVDAAGTISAPVTIARLAVGRAGGYPRMAAYRDELVFAWVDQDGALKTAAARLSVPVR